MQADVTVLDLAHAAMDAAPDDAAARLRFYARLAEAELFLLIESDEGDCVQPVVFELAEGRFVMAFDREDRLAAFADAPSPYAALPGRVLVQRLAGTGTGLGLNLGVAPSAFLMPATAVDWLAGQVSEPLQLIEARPAGFLPPGDVPAAVVEALRDRIGSMEGLARHAVLARARYDEGEQGLVVAVIDAAPGARSAIAQALAEAVGFSGGEMAAVDVLFLAGTDPDSVHAAQAGMVFDMTPPAMPEPAQAPAAPGSDPDRPPRLR